MPPPPLALISIYIKCTFIFRCVSLAAVGGILRKTPGPVPRPRRQNLVGDVGPLPKMPRNRGANGSERAEEGSLRKRRVSRRIKKPTLRLSDGDLAEINTISTGSLMVIRHI